MLYREMKQIFYSQYASEIRINGISTFVNNGDEKTEEHRITIMESQSIKCLFGSKKLGNDRNKTRKTLKFILIKFKLLLRQKALNDRRTVSLHEARQMSTSLIDRNLHGAEPQ